MKRLTAFLIACLVAFTAMVTPARAFLPVPIVVAEIVSASGVYAVGVLSGLVGVAGLYLTLKDAQDNQVRIPLGPNTNNEPPAPSAASSVSPSSSNYYCTTQSFISSQCFQDAQSWCSYYANLNWGEGGSMIGSTCWRRGIAGWVGADPAYPVTDNSCPAGYSFSGGSCVLQNARRATDDKTCDILLSSGQFATADDMNCGATVDGTKLAPMIRDGKVIAYGTNSSGQPLMWEVTPGSAKYTVREYQQVQTETQTQVQTKTITVDAATSEITSTEVQTSPGKLETPGSQSVPTQAEPTTENTPTVTQDTTKPIDKITCGLPGTPACAIDDTQFSNRDDFSTPNTSSASDHLDTLKTGVENSKDILPGINTSWLPSLLPGSTTSCDVIPISFTISSGPAAGLSGAENLDICPHLDVIRQILGYLFGISAVFYIWRSFTRSNEGA